MGTANPNIVPSQAFQTYDNKYVNVSVHREEYWPKLCKALGLTRSGEGAQICHQCRPG